jgi:two-component system C4-dicarboxylate transport sensor histidine kinase DctB
VRSSAARTALLATAPETLSPRRFKPQHLRAPLAAATRHLPAPRSRAGLLVGAAALLLAAALFALIYTASMSIAIERLEEEAGRRLDLGVVALDSGFSRFDYLPTLLETTPEVQAVLRSPADPRLRHAANLALARLNAIAGSDIIFVLEPGGLALSSSDWNTPETTAGHWYDFRPYMTQALELGRGRFFGIGNTTRRLGYFLSYALARDDRVIGVVTVKANLDRAERTWANQPGEMFMTDEHGVVLMSTREEWKLHALQPLDAAQRAQVAAQRPYALDLPLLGWAPGRMADGGKQRVRMADGEHLVMARVLPHTGWHLHTVDALAPLQASARNRGLIGALLIAVGWLGVVAAWQSRHSAMQKLAAQAALERAYASLEQRVDERTQELRDANASLEAEIDARKSIEQNLRQTQSELVHAARMAVLGRVSAGLAHEINQPLAALRTLSDNAVLLLDKQRVQDTRGNLERMSQIVGRLGEITRRLKTFAHRPGDRSVPTPLQAAVSNALALVSERMRRDGVGFDVRIEPESLTAMAEPAQLEQVLVNLVVNALDAMSTSATRRLSLRAWLDGSRVRVCVSDTGTGIDPAILSRLFEPFETTKPRGAGLGMGLNISRRIVRDFGGDIVARNNPGGGASFEIELPAATETVS